MTISTELAGIVLIVLGSCLGGVIWLIRLEGRVEHLSERMDEHIEGADQKFSELIRKIDTLTAKVDRLQLNCVAASHLGPEAYGVGSSLARRKYDEPGE